MNAVTKAILVLALLAVGCGTPDSAPNTAGTWVGTITTQGNVTTVINESGSVWGGEAQLVEEMSIGVEVGQDAYMFGRVMGVVASADRIYVLDNQIPVVRVYDLAGRHLMDIGGPGGGPGEFNGPDYLAIGPDGAIYVRAGVEGRLTIFEADGRLRDTWPMDSGRMTSQPTVITPSGTVFMPHYVTSDGIERLNAMVSWGPDGAGEEVIEEPPLAMIADYQLVARGDGPTLWLMVPFAPRRHWMLAPSGAVITGVSNGYSFEIHQPDGERVMVHKKSWVPVAVDPEEADWRRQDVFDTFRSFYPEWSWDGPEIPPTKPAFVELHADRDGRVWVYRGGLSAYNPACDDPEPPRGTDCWIAETIVDVFAPDGRYFGGVDMPVGLERFPPPYIRGDMVVGVVQDEAGTIMVKRYRLVLPGEAGK